MSMLDLVTGISKAPHNRTTVILGKPGAGKTTFAGTFPKPMLYISLGKDGGGEVLKKYSDNDVKLLSLEGTSDTSLYANVMSVLDELSSTKTEFKSVVIDAYTSIQEQLIKFIEGKKGKQLNQQEYGSIGKMMLDLRDKIDFLATRDDTEYVLICHIKENEQTDSITGETTKELVPKMTLNNGKVLLEHASAVLYCCKKTVLDENKNGVVKFLTYVGAHPNIDTKFRTKGDKLLGSGKYFENFTYEEMKKLYDGETTIEEQKEINVIEPTSNPFEQKENNDNEEIW